MKLCKILVLAIALAWAPALLAGVSIDVTGATDNDSVRIHVNVTDTTVYPQPVNPDTLYILRFSPDGTLLDSVFWQSGSQSSNIWNLRPGWFSAHYKAANGSATLGDYDFYVVVKHGNDGGTPAAGVVRGHIAGTYRVEPYDRDYYLQSILSGMHYWPMLPGCASIYFKRIVGTGESAVLVTDSIQTLCSGTVTASIVLWRTGAETTAVDSISNTKY